MGRVERRLLSYSLCACFVFNSRVGKAKLFRHPWEEARDLGVGHKQRCAISRSYHSNLSDAVSDVIDKYTCFDSKIQTPCRMQVHSSRKCYLRKSIILPGKLVVSKNFPFLGNERHSCFSTLEGTLGLNADARTNFGLPLTILGHNASIKRDMWRVRASNLSARQPL